MSCSLSISPRCNARSSIGSMGQASAVRVVGSLVGRLPAARVVRCVTCRLMSWTRPSPQAQPRYPRPMTETGSIPWRAC